MSLIQCIEWANFNHDNDKNVKSRNQVIVAHGFRARGLMHG